MTFKMPIVSTNEMAARFHQNWQEQQPNTPTATTTTTTTTDTSTNLAVDDDQLTDLNWLQNLNIMTKIGAPTPETPPASPVPSPDYSKSPCCMLSTKTANKQCPKIEVEDVVDYKTDGSTKPPYSYATLICMAMKANKNKMTLSAIYKWIKENFLYYRDADPSWQNSIRHNLSLNKCFIKIPRSKDEPGKGGFWRLDPQYAESLVDGVFKKRRPSQRQGGGGGSKKTRKDKLKGQSDTLARVLESFQQDTPPNSAGSLLAHSDMELMDLKPVQVMSSPSHQDVFAYATTSSNMCEYQADRLLVQASHRQPMHRTLHDQEAEVLAVLEPISHNGLVHAGVRPLQNTIVNGHTNSDLYWNEVLGDQDLELDSLYKYRPEDSISSVVNTALALNDDLFSSDGSSSELPTELDLVPSDNLDISGVNHGIPQNTDWWGFQQPGLDVTVTPLLSISVPFGNTGVSAMPGSNAVLTNGNSNGVFINGYVQNGSTFVVDRQQLQHQQQQDLLQSQQWAECKAGLEAATLDLDDLGDLDGVHAY